MAKKVLFINDVRSLLMLSSFLSSTGFEVDMVQDIESGMEYLQDQPYDIIILLESAAIESSPICERIRELTDTPLIVISLNASTETCVKAINAGADYFLRKSFGPLEFLARINSLLQRNTARLPFSIIS
jgi:DNA-binding response OmpR family regulator